MVPVKPPQTDLRSLATHSLGLPYGWTVENVEWEQPFKSIRIQLDISATAVWSCPLCRRRAPLHDTISKSWRHLDLWSFETWVYARVPRTCCPDHGVRVVAVSWAEPRARITRAFDARVQRLLDEGHRVATVAKVVGQSWDRVKRKTIAPTKPVRPRRSRKE